VKGKLETQANAYARRGAADNSFTAVVPRRGGPSWQEHKWHACRIETKAQSCFASLLLQGDTVST
jgi:hypothetical protein